MKPTPVDLTNCDREPIHIPGSIQPHGFLIACDLGLDKILRHSTNVAEHLDRAADSLIGQKIDTIFGARSTHTLRNALSRSLESRPMQLSGLRLDARDEPADVSVHRHKGVAIVEIEPASDDSRASLETTRTLIARIRDLPDVASLVDQAARLLRALLGYDRVMIYKFAENGSGQVIAESRRPDLESFLGQHFPASDIPQQARQLYLRNTIRVISDAAGKTVPILPVLDASGEALDLSHAHLRSVSPIHCEYLRNMGVAASMSISIIIDGELWGLIACHHYSKRALSMGLRAAAELFGEFISLQLYTLQQRERVQNAAEARRLLDGFLRDFSAQSDFHGFLRDNLPDLARLISSDGAGLWIAGNWSSFGTVPPRDAVPALADFVKQVADGKIWATHELGAHLAGAHAYRALVSGVLAIPLTQEPRDYLLFFRREVIETVEWGGDPNKSYDTGPFGDRLTPRKSFAIWKEEVEAQSQPWSPADREIAEAARVALLEIILRHAETLSDERRRADIRQKVLHEELNHRVKNILALIKSLVSQPVTAAQGLADYVETLKRRIMALSHAHDQIIRNEGGGNLSDLLSAELSPYRENAAGIALDGPEIAIEARAFSVLTLVIHELATNAAKYGALSIPGGALAVDWMILPDGSLELRWKEKGGPPVRPPERKGFGTLLVDRSIPFDLGGKSEVNYLIDGVAATFVIPAKFLSKRPIARKPVAASRTSGATTSDSLAGISILLVEDQPVIAMDAESMLAAYGARDIRTCSTESEALASLATAPPHVAVLDVNLGTASSASVAAELRRRGIPFVFATGYSDTAMIPKALSDVPIVRKPYAAETLTSAVIAALTLGASPPPVGTGD